MLKGDLSSFSLGEVFQSLAINNHTGTLKITSRDYPPKYIYFDQGKITLFSSGAPGVPRLGEMLLRMGCITQEDLDSALEEQKTTKKLLGKILIKRELISGADLKKALETKIREEIYDLFLWKEGHFEFHLDYFPDDLIDDIQRKARIALDANSVTMGGMRQLDEWGRIHQYIRTFNEVLTPTSKSYTGKDSVERALLERVDGSIPVKEILKEAPASQFDSCKALHDLIEAGYLRLLTIEELNIRASKAVSERKHAQAAAILQFATELEPDKPEHYLRLGDAYSGYYQDELAAAAYLKAMRLCFQEGDRHQATAIGDKILHKTKLSDEDLDELVQGHIALGNVKRASAVGGQLVVSLQKKGEFQKAAATLQSLSRLQPKDLNLRIQLATLLERSGDQEGAEECLEEVAGTLEKEKRYHELIRILRLILEVNPERGELKRRITEIQTLEEKRRRRRKRRFIVAGCSAAAFCILVLAPLVYEIKARECFYHAQRLEGIAKTSGDFSQAKAAYEEVIEFFFWNTMKGKARSALARIRSDEASRLAEYEEEQARIKQEQEARLAEMKAALASAVKEANAAVEAGDLERAHRIYDLLKKEWPDYPAIDRVHYPLLISSYPGGANVIIDSTRIGQTPVLYYYKPGTKVRISLSRSSCETLHKAEELVDQWKLHYDLERRPLARFTPVPVIEQPFVLAGGNLIIPSRDGKLYAVDPENQITRWQRTVGRFGDRVSNLGAHGAEVYLGTVSAEVTAISATTGRSRWITRVDGSVLAAPGVSHDGKWLAVGTTTGAVYILSNENGELLAKFSTENEILARPLVVDGMVVVGSTDNHVYGYSMKSQKLEFLHEVSQDVVLDPCQVAGGVVVATRDGRLHRFDLEAHRLVWTWTDDGDPGSLNATLNAIACREGKVYLGTSEGELVVIDGRGGEVLWRAGAGRSAVTGLQPAADKVYLTLLDGRLIAVDSNEKKPAWGYQSPSALVAPPVLEGGIVYFGADSGLVQFMEVLE